ncbi:MAG: zinc ribbon domain-containing protein [Dehalococcoidia bacterium]
MSSAFCTRCGTQGIEGDAFCAKCGASLRPPEAAAAGDATVVAGAPPAPAEPGRDPFAQTTVAKPPAPAPAPTAAPAAAAEPPRDPFAARPSAPPPAAAGQGQELVPVIDRAMAPDMARANVEAQLVLEELRDGKISGEVAQERLYRAGLVKGDKEAWLLDLKAGTWVRYDGYELVPLSAIETVA